MMMRKSGLSWIRAAALVLAGAFLSNCSGGSRMLPAAPAAVSPALAVRPAIAQSAQHRTIKTLLRIRIPRGRRSPARLAHPATISALTQSVGITINGGAALVFNTTPSSPGCAIGASGLVCTFAVSAPVGTDTFVATTYSAPSAGGIVLDRGTAKVPIVAGQANAVAVSLGPVVTTTADHDVGSLRYAIASASPGDTIVFLLPAGSTIALDTPITVNGSVTIAGPGVNTNNITITGGGAHQLFVINGTATISGLTLTGGKAATPGSPGGAISNLGALTLAGDSIGNSTSIVQNHLHPHKASRSFHPHNCSPTYAWGGAVYNDDTLVISGTTFNDNVVDSDEVNCISAQGGAIYNDTNGTLSSTGDTYTNNSAMYGGAVYNVGTGPVSFSGDTFNANTGCNVNSGCPTTGCSTSGCTTFAQGSGAAIFDNGSGATITNSTFTNNVTGGVSQGSKGLGGAVAFNAGAPSVTGSTFTGNLAGGGNSSCSEGLGGAILSNTILEIDNDTFTNNQAVGDSPSSGGAVLDGDSSGFVQGTNDTFTSNSVVASGSTCSVYSNAIGGAVYALGIATLTNSTFSKNSVNGNGEGAAGAVGAQSVVANNDTFTSNSAVATGAQGASATGAGGAIYAQNFLKMANDTFTSNSVTAAGPTAYGGAVVSGGITNSNGNTFTSNTINQTAGSGQVAGGGGLAAISGTASSTGDVFTSNSVTSGGSAVGGGVFGQTYFASNSNFTSNSTNGPVSGGGAIGSQQTEITKSTLTGNAANGGSTAGLGGAVYASAGMIVVNSTISKNTAVSSGGGVLTGGVSTISDSSIIGNSVTNGTNNGFGGGGGGIFSTNAAITVSTSTIANNSVALNGGAGGGGIAAAAGLALEQSTVSGNTVTGTGMAGFGGGGITGVTISAVNSTIANNSTTGDGGGVQVSTGGNADSFINVTIYKNAATGKGGGIDNLSSSTTLTNSIVAGGSAGTGPDINNAGSMSSGDYNIIQTALAGTAFSMSGMHDKAVDPQLLSLANNGGPTFTNADQVHGPGTGIIPFSNGKCGSAPVTIDQRGYSRGANNVCDAGAFEYGGVATAIRHRTPRLPAGESRGKSLIVVRPLRLPAFNIPPAL